MNNNQFNQEQQIKTENQGFSTSQQTNNGGATNQTSLPDNFWMAIVGQSLPLLFEKFTGQKIQMNGPEIAQALLQIQNGLQMVVSQQQALSQRLANLENNATQQFTNLVQQVQSIKSIRLSHEKKQIDYNLQQENESNKY